MIDLQDEPDGLDPESLLFADRLISRQLWKAIGISTQHAPIKVSFCPDCGGWGCKRCAPGLDPAQQALPVIDRAIDSSPVATEHPPYPPAWLSRSRRGI